MSFRFSMRGRSSFLIRLAAFSIGIHSPRVATVMDHRSTGPRFSVPCLPAAELNNVSQEVRASILEDLPEIAGIVDDGLREKVIQAWALSLRDSSFTRISDIPGEGAPNHFVLKTGSQELHLRGVAR